MKCCQQFLTVSHRATILGLLLLSGCAAVGPDYQRPDAPLPTDYPEAAGTAGPAAPAAPMEQRWWTLFHDPALDRLIEQALIDNQDLQLAVSRVAEAEAVVREARAAFYPAIDLAAGDNRSRSAKTATSGPIVQNRHTLTLSTAFELDVWGRLRRANESALAQALASRYARDTVRLSIAGLTANQYLTLRAYDAQLAVTQDTIKSREGSLHIVRNRVEAGLVSPLDLHQSEGSLAAAKAQLASLRQQRALVEHQLALLVGEPGLTISPGDLSQLPLPPPPPSGLPSKLLEARPDVRQTEQELVAANAEIGVAKAAFFPTISLTGSLGAQSPELNDLLSRPANTWSMGWELVTPLFDAGRIVAQVDQATARREQAVAHYRKTVQTAFKEVNDALASLRENANGEQAQAAQVEAAKKTLRLARVRYEAGYSGYLEVLDAERTVNDALLSHIATRQSRLIATVDLFKALGGGWEGDVGQW
ncbi:MAG: efflux transporter outer membrane subunit [Gammaproteobacteria bacterium]|nr:efflux transporter outer membrane subunit [Gammaproteobacteria bacterium]